MSAERRVLSAVVLCAVAAGLSAQGPPRIDAVVAAVRPALPFPAADVTGELPAQGGANARWFVVWPDTSGDGRIHVKANPLHPDTQAAGLAAMARIQAAVEAAERKAQAAYDRALEELKKTGKPTNLDGVTLEDEGIEGERIDAELELTIELNAAAQSFEIGSSVPPVVTRGSSPSRWLISTAPNTYRETSISGSRERFRPAEMRMLFGVSEQPEVSRRNNDHHFVVLSAPSRGAFSIVIRGNAELLKQIVSTSDWNRIDPAAQ